MAESKGVMLAKSVQKHAGRAKEKILQNLGKVDRTADEIFDDHLNNFNRQQNSANKLQKEFNNYIRCVRAIQGASKSLMDAICEIYEPNWSGYDALIAQTSASDSLWQDFAHKLGDQVLIPLNTYTGQFPEMKKKIEKRNRKLIDYDGQRHSFQSLQASANKRKDDVKLTKGREQLEEARRTYEILNTELHDELPALYDSRILFLVTNLQTLFASEQVFHNETAKIYAELEAIVDKLATESQRGSHTLKKPTVNAIKASPVQSPVKQMSNSITNNHQNNYQNQNQITNGASSVNSPTSSPTTTSTQPEQSSPRLDSISSTPETPEMQRKVTSATTGSSTAATTPLTPYSGAYRNGSGEGDNDNEDDDDEEATAAAHAYPYEHTMDKEVVEGAKKVQKHRSIDIDDGDDDDDDNADAVAARATVAAAAAISSTSGNDNEKPNSPNANSAATAAAASAESSTVNSNASNTTITPTKPVAAAAAAATTTTTTTTTTTATTDEAMNNISKMAKPSPQTDSPLSGAQMNGNGNMNNGNNMASKMKGDNDEARNDDDEDEDNNHKKLLDVSTTDLPPGVLYRVKATYGYVKEDVDELSFEIGDIIRVIEYDDPEDQEDGWLMGQKEGTSEKGLFPANFTRPI